MIKDGSYKTGCVGPDWLEAFQASVADGIEHQNEFMAEMLMRLLPEAREALPPDQRRLIISDQRIAAMKTAAAAVKTAAAAAKTHFFRRYARALRDLDRIEDMRLAMRTSIDLTQEIPMAVVIMVHMYMPLRSRETLEDLPATQWLLDRYAEALAALDFSGLHDTPFRNAFDNYQFALRAPEQTDAIKAEIEALCAKNSEDIALQTLYNLFKAGLIR